MVTPSKRDSSAAAAARIGLIEVHTVDQNVRAGDGARLPTRARLRICSIAHRHARTVRFARSGAAV